MTKLCSVLLAAVLTGPWLSAENKLPLLFTGVPFHGDEVSAVSGSEWLALYRVAEHYELGHVSISVSLVNDPIVDPDEEATGKLVSVAGSPESLVLIPLGLGLLEGAVDHAATEITLLPDREQVIPFDDDRYVLKSVMSSRAEGSCLVTLDDGAKKQTLAELDQCDEDTYPRRLSE